LLKERKEKNKLFRACRKINLEIKAEKGQIKYKFKQRKLEE